LHGLIDFDSNTLGDPIVRRRDGCFAYQLAGLSTTLKEGVTDVCA